MMEGCPAEIAKPGLRSTLRGLPTDQERMYPMSGSAFAPVPPGTDARKESLIEYPCAFPIKVMGGNIPGFVAALVHVAQRFDPAFEDASVELRESKGGKYLGVTLTVNVTSREHLDELYRTLSSHPMVKVVL